MSCKVGIATWWEIGRAYLVKELNEEKKNKHEFLEYPEQVYVCMEGEVEETPGGNLYGAIPRSRSFKKKVPGPWTIENVWERALWNGEWNGEACELMWVSNRMKFKESMEGKVRKLDRELKQSKYASCQDSNEGKEKKCESYCEEKVDSQTEYEQGKVRQYMEECKRRMNVTEAGWRCLEECAKICKDMNVTLEEVKDFLREIKCEVGR